MSSWKGWIVNGMISFIDFPKRSLGEWPKTAGYLATKLKARLNFVHNCPVVTSHFELNSSKLMRLGPTNWIVDNSDIKPFKFDGRLQSDSDSNDDIVLTIEILIKIWSIFD